MYLAYKDTNILFKILPCILIAIFLVMIMGSSVFAFDFTTSKGESYSIFDKPNDGNEYFVVLYYSGDFINILTSSTQIGHGYDKYGGSATCLSGTNLKIYRSVSGDFTSLFGLDGSRMQLFSTGSNGRMYTSSNSLYSIGSILYSSHDVLNKSGEMVFQAALQEGELVKATKSINFLEVLQEILGILPIILLIVIGLLGLRKAISLIFQMLRKA